VNRTALVALLLPLAIAPVGLAGTPAYAAPTCHGLPVTLQGTPGANLQGTPGNDVIDTNGAQAVLAGSGDDTICVTNSGLHVGVLAGEGNDYIEAAEAHEVVATLGAGADTYRGGAGYDAVVAGENNGGAADLAVDTEADDVETGAGGDVVFSGRDGLPNADRLLLGDGDDGAFLRGTTAAADAGSGDNRLTPFTDPADPATWGLDTTSGVLTRDGVAMWSIPGFTRFSLRSFAQGGGIVIRGSRADEHFELWERPGGGRVDVAAGGGDDDIVVNESQSGLVDGQRGHDELLILDTYLADTPEQGGRIDLRLDRGRATVVSQGTTHRWRLGRFESVTSSGFYRASAVGTRRGELIRIGGACHVTVDGRGGDDTLARRRGSFCGAGGSGGRDQSTLVHGGPGDDRLIGSQGPEVLIGDSGRDQAEGRAGIDRCEAEREFGCEL
jgi:Ca2+-binding RTX toxin-like protein